MRSQLILLQNKSQIAGKGVRDSSDTTLHREDVSKPETATSTSCFGDNDYDCTPTEYKRLYTHRIVTCVSFIIEASLKRN